MFPASSGFQLSVCIFKSESTDYFQHFHHILLMKNIKEVIFSLGRFELKSNSLQVLILEISPFGSFLLYFPATFVHTDKCNL